MTKLILTHEHKRLLHCGPQLLLATVRQTYWPTSGMNAVKAITRNCVKCFKVKPQSITSIMADLPKQRVTAMTPFHVTGVDYAGPFNLKDRKGRGCKIIKCYICVFICFSSKAMHLELVSDLTTESFIASLRRFASRRGKPAHIYSDNGTNFVGAQKQLKDLYNFILNSTNDITNICAHENISWHFIPPNAPHFGGLWESGVKRVKYHLQRVLGNVTLTYEEFLTVLVQIEAILNSRPLHPLSSDPNDLQPLTPSHFLIGKPMITVPDPSLKDIQMNRLTRFQLLQQLNQHFWKRWSTEYLSCLQQMRKWKEESTNLKLDTPVIIKNDNLPPCTWLIGRVVDVHPGPDNIIRVASVKTAKGIMKRPITKICPLPIPEGDSEVKQ